MTCERILIIEDEVKISRFLELELIHEGYQVDTAFDGRSGLDKLHSGSYDLVILDVMLPGLNGMEVLRRLRQSGDVPVIMLTAKDSVTDKVMGLDMGADDYLTKPFAIEELLARIRVTLKRRGRSADTTALKIGNLVIDATKRTASYKNSVLDLTKTEFDLLYYLVSNKNIALSRDKILENVWGYDYTGDTNIVDVYIRYLRSKIDDKADDKLIHTVRGIGYVVRGE